MKTYTIRPLKWEVDDAYLVAETVFEETPYYGIYVWWVQKKSEEEIELEKEKIQNEYFKQVERLLIPVTE